jgi:hypothetical protein
MILQLTRGEGRREGRCHAHYVGIRNLHDDPAERLYYSKR